MNSNKTSTAWWVRSIGLLFRSLPRPVKWIVAETFARIWWFALPQRRRVLLRNITHVFPNWSRQQRIRFAHRTLREMCWTFNDLLSIPGLSKNWVDRNIIFEGFENWEVAKSQNRGVLAMSLHLGSGDLGVSAMALRGIPVHVISKRFKNKSLDSFWFGLRTRQGAQFMDPHGSETAYQILSALRKNQMVVFVLDQYMGPPYGLKSSFFGRSTGTAYGLALFAFRTQAPVVPIYTYRDDHGRTHVCFEPPMNLEFDPSGKRDAQMLSMTEQLNRKLEQIILKFPEQWMWVHRRWKEFG